jgi:hypothetical protein
VRRKERKGLREKKCEKGVERERKDSSEKET